MILRQSSYTAMVQKHGLETSPKDHTHPLDCLTEAVLYQDSVSTSTAVMVEDRCMVIYMILTSRTGRGERFVMAVLGDRDEAGVQDDLLPEPATGIGGYCGRTPSSRLAGANYEAGRTNEVHSYNLTTGKR